jgi:hypothetical protein
MGSLIFIDLLLCQTCEILMRLSENAYLPFGRLTALSKVDPSTPSRVDAEQGRSIEGLRYPIAAYFDVRLNSRDFGSSRTARGISQSSTCTWTFSNSLKDTGFSTLYI